jgi:hypothetical protein
MSKALDDFARGFGAALKTPQEINSTAETVREAVSEVKTGAEIFLLLQVSMTISSAIIAYCAFRNLKIQERRNR